MPVATATTRTTTTRIVTAARWPAACARGSAMTRAPWQQKQLFSAYPAAAGKRAVSRPRTAPATSHWASALAASSPSSCREFSRGASVANAAHAAAMAKEDGSSSNSNNSSNSSSADHEYIPGTDIPVFRTVAALRRWRQQAALHGRRVSLVPTMGALHDGHLRLLAEAVHCSDAVVVSVYVNPAQFGVTEDLSSYPRTWVADCEKLAAVAAAAAAATPTASPTNKQLALFAPTTAEMYPSGPPSQEVDGDGSFVTITPAGRVLEGAHRPTFFRGVATVCLKLFLIVQPHIALFGSKDIQQAVVLRRLVRDLHVPLALRIVPTVRSAVDGLAESSRNVYLGARRRAVAPVLRRAMVAADCVAVPPRGSDGGQTAAGAGSEPAGRLGSLSRLLPESRDNILGAARRVLDAELAAQMQLPPDQRVRFEIDYLSLAEPDSMQEIDRIDPTRGAILSAAMRMLPVEAPQPGEDLGYSGGPMVRLIDNIYWKGTEGGDDSV